MINTVILDLDGPLLDGIDRHYACYSRILRDHGFAPVSKETFWNGKRLRCSRRVLLDQSQAGEFYDQFLKAWLADIESPEMLSRDRLQPGVTSVLKGWQDAGLRLVLATMRNNKPNTLEQLARLGLSSFFDTICITGSTDSGGKAAAVQAAIGRMDSSAPHAVWVGDTEADIRAAKTLGIPIFAVTCGLRTESLLRAEAPDAVVLNLQAAAASLQALRDCSGVFS